MEQRPSVARPHVHVVFPLARFVIDGNKTIAQGDEVQKVPEIEIEAHEVYAIDICFSSGEGKVRRWDLCRVACSCLLRAPWLSSGPGPSCVSPAPSPCSSHVPDLRRCVMLFSVYHLPSPLPCLLFVTAP